jgi:hypothetical protein
MKTCTFSQGVVPLLPPKTTGKNRVRFLTLLFAVLLGSAGNFSIVPTAAGQEYSVNTVAYVNVAITGVQLISNPLNHLQGNTVNNVFHNPPNGLMIYKFNQAMSFRANIYYTDAGWIDPTMTLSPGEGAYAIVPAGVVYTATFVGAVPVGSLRVELLPGLNLLSSPVPQAGKLAADLGFPGRDGDVIYQWSAPVSRFKAPNGFEFGAWSLGDPIVAVAEGFFLNSASRGTWSRTFSVSGGGTPTLLFTDIRFVNNNLRLEATGGGTLQSAATVTGPWTDVIGSVLPFTTVPSSAQQYFRLKR